MTMTQVNFRIQNSLKGEADKLLRQMGFSMSSAITVFLQQVVTQRRMPFSIVADPFYCDENIKELTRRAEEMSRGENTSVHELISEEDFVHA